MSIRSLVLILASLFLGACGEGPLPETGGAATARTQALIIASNYPLYYFAQEIAGDSVQLVLPSMEGDPADWKPDSESIAQMQSADLLILNGAAYESWLNWISLPNSVLLDTAEGIRDRLLPLSEETIHQHGPAGEHSHPGPAFTIWLNPLLAIEQARAIEEAISTLVPQNREAHRTRLALLEARLAGLDDALGDAFASLGGQPVIFSHPVYQYLADRYTLNGMSMHWEPGEDPSVKAWIDFQDILRDHPAQIMIWEGGPGEKTADKLEQLGLRSIVFQTGANRPENGDYFQLMEANIERLLAQ
jgi:zinc transport system substrate-binding protein